MFKTILAILTMIGIPFSLCSQQKTNMDKTQANTRILVAYFSATGTTAKVAEKLADATAGELHAIVPAQPYTASDLDWNDSSSRSSKETNNPSVRPAIGGKAFSTDRFDVVFLGYPIWWDMAPRIINTFIESHNLEGKTIIPFATSGSSGISNSIKVLKETYPHLQWKEGKLLNHASDNDIRKWVKQLGY